MILVVEVLEIMVLKNEKANTLTSVFEQVTKKYTNEQMILKELSTFFSQAKKFLLGKDIALSYR